MTEALREIEDRTETVELDSKAENKTENCVVNCCFNAEQEAFHQVKELAAGGGWIGVVYI